MLRILDLNKLNIIISFQDVFKLYLGFFSILISKNILKVNNKINYLIIIYTFFISLFGWELWWTKAYNFVPLCYNKIAFNYTKRAIECNIPTNHITNPEILHALSNTFSDIFLIIIIFHIGLYAVPNALQKNISIKNKIKYMCIISILGVSQNMLLDSRINFFPKYCCGYNNNKWCPISWSPLAPCQYCPYINNNLVTICYNTEILWFLVPNIIYLLSIYTNKIINFI